MPGPHCANRSRPASHCTRLFRRPPWMSAAHTQKAVQAHVPKRTRRPRNIVFFSPSGAARKCSGGRLATWDCQAWARRAWRTPHNPPRRCRRASMRARRLRYASRGSEGTCRTRIVTATRRRCNASTWRRKVCVGGHHVMWNAMTGQTRLATCATRTAGDNVRVADASAPAHAECVGVRRCVRLDHAAATAPIHRRLHGGEGRERHAQNLHPKQRCDT